MHFELLDIIGGKNQLDSSQVTKYKFPKCIFSSYAQGKHSKHHGRSKTDKVIRDHQKQMRYWSNKCNSASAKNVGIRAGWKPHIWLPSVLCMEKVKWNPFEITREQYGEFDPLSWTNWIKYKIKAKVKFYRVKQVEKPRKWLIDVLTSISCLPPRGDSTSWYQVPTSRTGGNRQIPASEW